MRIKTELFLHTVGIYLEGLITHRSGSSLRAILGGGGPETINRQLQRLHERAYLDSVDAHESKDRVYRLTELARVAARGHPVDPRERWQRMWDGTWRLVAFDLPEIRHTARESWRRELRRLKFGCLQGSVWISPDPVGEIKVALAGAAVRTQRLIFFEGRPSAGESDAQIVRAAWNFERIQQLYLQHQKVLESVPAATSELAEIRARLPNWTKREFIAWKEILRVDPFLPASLCPPDYPGPTALEAREAALRRAARLARKLLSHEVAAEA